MTLLYNYFTTSIIPQITQKKPIEIAAAPHLFEKSQSIKTTIKIDLAIILF